MMKHIKSGDELLTSGDFSNNCLFFKLFGLDGEQFLLKIAQTPPIDKAYFCLIALGLQFYLCKVLWWYD